METFSAALVLVPRHVSYSQEPERDTSVRSRGGVLDPVIAARPDVRTFLCYYLPIVYVYD